MLNLANIKIWYLVYKWTSLICTVFLLLLCINGLPLKVLWALLASEVFLWLKKLKVPIEEWLRVLHGDGLEDKQGSREAGATVPTGIIATARL